MNDDKVSLKTESRDGADCYRIDVTNTPKRAIDVPVLTVVANREDELFDKPARTFYGTRTLGGTEGESADDYMSATDSSYLIPKFDGQWYAVKDAAGAVHLAADASDHSVYASFYSMDGKSMGTGELIFDADGNASSIYIYGNTIPIALDTFEGMVLVALCNDPSLGTATTIDTFMLEGTNAKLVKDSCSNLGIHDVEVRLAISDMYDVQHEVKPELEFDPAGGQWKDGTAAVKKFEAALETSFDIIDAPIRDGYTFVCWKGSEYQPGQKYLADSDHTFTAQWEKNSGDDPTGSDNPVPGNSGGSVNPVPGSSGGSGKQEINTPTVTAAKIAAATASGATTVTLGPKVKKIAKGAFKGTRVTTVVVKTKKLKKKSVRGAFKGSSVKTVKVAVKDLKPTKGLKGKALKKAKKYNKKARAYNKKIAKKYRKFMTKKVVGKKVAVRP